MCVDTGIVITVTCDYVVQENAVLEEAKRWDAWRKLLEEKQLDAAACVKRSEVCVCGSVSVHAQ